MTQHIPSAIQSLAPFVSAYGYLGVGAFLFLEDFGVIVPGETVLITAAFYAGLGHLNIFLLFIIGFLASVLGDNVGFAIGKYGGHPLIERYGKYVFLTPQRISKTERFFSRYGGRVVIVARFIDGLRQINGILAGLSEMLWRRFLIYNSIGAAIWVGLWLAVGYFGGSHIVLFLHYELYFTTTVFCGFIIFVLYKFMKRRKVAR